MGIWAFWSQSQMVYSANVMQADFSTTTGEKFIWNYGINMLKTCVNHSENQVGEVHLRMITNGY